ncbi:MAG: hypothetical protein ACK5P6_09730 [Pseudobdellovibrionaceae bacterium]|jgi:hypothetical protein
MFQNAEYQSIQRIVLSNKPDQDFQEVHREMKELGLDFIIDERIKDLLLQGYDYEIWTRDMEFIVASKRFLGLTSYSLDQLLTTHWGEMFHRDDLNKTRIVRAIEKVFKTQQPQISVTPKHVVQEIASKQKVALEVEVLEITPFWNHHEDLNFSGLLAVTKLQEIDASEFVSESSSSDKAPLNH